MAPEASWAVMAALSVQPVPCVALDTTYDDRNSKISCVSTSNSTSTQTLSALPSSLGNGTWPPLTSTNGTRKKEPSSRAACLMSSSDSILTDADAWLSTS